MFTKTLLATALIFGAASAALAGEIDPNPYNRYPAYNMTQLAAPAFESRDVALTTGHAAISKSEQSWFDRASRNANGL